MRAGRAGYDELRHVVCSLYLLYEKALLICRDQFIKGKAAGVKY